MTNLHHPSSPIKRSVPPTDTRSATQSEKDINRSSIVQDIACEDFRRAYLSGSSPGSWVGDEQSFVSQIQAVLLGDEESLYTNDAPLLRLLNSMSKRVANNGQEALVFRAGNKCRVKNPFTDQYRLPDIIVQWEQSDAFRGINYSTSDSSNKTWTELVAIGEVKVSESGGGQLSGYLQNHLQLHPELNATLGFTIRSTGYALFYHDAAVIHRSEFQWEPGPLYEFIAKLYTRPFRDLSMQIQNAQAPTWATKVGDVVYFSRMSDIQRGPGQRRYTTEAVNMTNEVVFIKDIWRDQRRFYFEGLLLNRAHNGKSLCGLMLPGSHGYVLDETQTPIRTTRLNSESATEEAPGRFKMRMVTKEIGQPLEGVHSLCKFLCVMYDACAVQRNLFRKCKIMHRDISDKNVMFAPDTTAYRERNQNGYAEVKFINQVIAEGDNIDPVPACLVIDLGNGADLEVERDTERITERTGTPKFIARSVSSGKLLKEDIFPSTRAKLPPVEGVLAEYHRRMHSTEYLVLNSRVLATQPEAKFAHRLFHDAESTFWVIAWTLARSIKVGSQQEKGPHELFSQFFHTMSRHYPIPNVDDSRQVFSYTTQDDWELILHPDLAILAPMLANMFAYIRPEWAYRPELNSEHVHETLMGLLLIEIIKMKNDGTDIDIYIGGRKPPPPLLGQDPLPKSMTSSHSKSATRSQTSRSTEPQTSSSAGVAGPGSVGSSKQRIKSRSAPQTQNITPDGPATRTRSQQRTTHTLVWPSISCELRMPESHGGPHL